MGLKLVVVVSLLSLAMGQIRPESSCSNFFQYVNNTAEEFQGEITLPSLKQGHNRIDLVFSQMGDEDDSSVGQLKPYPDEREILWSTGPYKFRIALKQSPSNGKPKLSQLAYNDQLLCGEYALYVSYYTRFYEFSKNESLDRPPSSPSVCGRQGSIAPFVIGGKKFPLGRYPWLSAIFHKDSAPVSVSYKCGGSLISSSVVISSAHCVYNMTEKSVLIGLGVHDISNYLEIGADWRNAKRLITHPEFRDLPIPDVDIALIIMERPVKFNEIIAPICLWAAKSVGKYSKAGIIAGWETKKNSSESQYPWVVEVDIVSPKDCVRDEIVWRDRRLCAAKRDASQGPCYGDSGGGLMVLQDDRWLLRGIASSWKTAPDGSCNPNQYVAYCDVAQHINWIKENIT